MNISCRAQDLDPEQELSKKYPFEEPNERQRILDGRKVVIWYKRNFDGRINANIKAAKYRGWNIWEFI